MNCTLTLEQQKQFYKKVFKDLSATVSDGKDFDIKNYILDFYNLVNNKTNDSSLALSYAQLLPENVINVTADDRNIAKYLRSKGVDLNTIYDLRDQFENIPTVEKYVSATVLTEDKLADIRKKAGLIGSQLEKAAESDPDVDFQAKPATGFTTTGQEELLDDNGIPTGEEDPDPVKIASYAFTRNLLRNLNATNLSNADTLKLEALNGTEIVGIYLSPIDIVKNGKSLVNLTFKTKVDDTYKQIYLNSDGIVTYIEGQDPVEGSILPISDFRTPSSVSGKADFFKRGTKELTVQTVEEQVESIIDKARKSNLEIPNREQLTAQFQNKRNNEVNFINQMVKSFIKNKSLTIPLSISGGKLGFSLTYGSYVPLSQIKDIADNNINFQFDKSGAAYMKINKYYNLLRVRPDKINADLASNLSKLLMDKGVSNPQKYLVFEAILNPDDANVRLIYNNTKDVLSLYVNGVQAFDSTIIEDADQDYLTEQLQNAYININKKYFGTSIEIPSYVGENYTPYTIDYTSFIKSNATADATLRNDGSIKQFNSTLNFEPTLDANKIIFPEKEVITTETKTAVKSNQEVNTSFGGFKGSINLDLINEINSSLKRAGFKPVSVSEEKIKEIKNWYSSLEVLVDGVPTKFSEVLPFKESFSLINSDVLGTFTTAGITLYAKAGNIDYTTLYHEAWHAFSQLLLTPEQKKSLYDTVRANIKKLNKATDKVVEEYLAEDFRNYVLSNGSKVNTKGTENIFQKLWRILKSIFSGQTEIIDATEIPVIKTMYDNLRLGNLFEYEYSLDNVQFGKLNRGIESLDSKDKGLSLSNSRLLVDSIDGSFAELIDKSELNFAALYKNKGALEYLYQLTKESFQEKLDFFRNEIANDPDGINTIARNNVAILEYAIDNFGDFNDVLSGKQKNGLIAYHKQKSKYLEIEAKLLEAEEDKSDVKDIEKFERTGNDLSLKELTSNQTLYLVKSMYEVNKNGTPKYNRLGFNKLVDFNKAWSIISKNLIGSNSFDDIYTRLIGLQNQYPPVAQLLSKLGNPENTLNSNTEFNKWIAFTQTFNKTVVPIIEQRLVSTTNPDGTTSISTYIQRATGDISKIASSFKNKFSTSRNEYITKEKGTNYLNLSAVLNKFKTINNTNAFDFLNAIGFYLDDNKSVKSAIENSFDLRYTQTSIQYDYILEALKNAKEKNIFIPDPIKYLRSEKGGNQATNVSKILEIQAQYGNADFGSAITNVEGNTEFETQLRNSLTNIVDDLNKLTYIDQMIDDAKYEHLRYYHPAINPYAKHSYIIKSLFDQTGNRRSDVTLSVENLGGLRRDVDGVTINGVKTNKLNIYDKYLYDVHATILGGTPELPRHASKSSSYGVALNKKYTGRTVDNLYLPIRSIAFSSDNGVTEAMPLITNYLMAELERIWYVKNIKSLKNVDTLSKNGDKIVAFDSVLSAETKQSLYGIVNKAKSISDIVINKKLQEDIYTDTFSYFNNQFAENLDIWKDLSTVTNGQVLLSPEVRIKLLKETRVGKSEANKYASSSEQINLIIKTFTFNNWFNNFEMQLFYGDLSQFDHLKEEFHKRNASIASTGEFAIVDRYTLGYLNATSQNSYAKSIDISTKEFSNKAITTVLDDAQPNSIYYDYYASLLLSMGIDESKVVNTLKPYKKIKEGDAQGWVTFDFYRNFLRSINKWSQDQENLYNQIINDPESVNPHKVKEFFPVLKASYYGPLKTELLNVTALHKFSLMPLVPTVVKGTNLEQFHKQLLEQGVDYALYKSGSKVSNITLNDGVIPSMYKDLNKRELYDGPYALNGIYLPYFKNQLDIAPYFKEQVTLASQLRKIIENNLYESGKPIKKEYAAVVEQYENSVKSYVDFYKNKLFKEVGVEFDDNGNIKKGDPKDLIKAIERELVRLEVPDFQLDILETNEDGTLKNNFDSIINSESIEKQLVAIIERKIVRPKIKGEQLVQVSGSGFEQYGFSKPFGEDLLKYGTNGLKFYTVENDKIQPMQVKVALQGDFLKLLTVTYEGSKINTLERLNEAIKNEGWLKDNANLLKMIGVRIPTQGLNSIEYMQVAEFLPAEAGSVIIVPTELVAKSGSDFDIDKLSIVMPNITVLTEELEELQKLYPDIDMSDIITKTANLTKDDTKVQAMENNILNSMISIMELKDNFPQLITPNETDIVKPISEDLAKYNREYNPVSKRANQDSAFKTISPTRALEIRYNLYKHEANNIGKLTIGIGAVSNTYNVILNRVGAFLNDTYEFKDNKGNPITRKSRLLLPYNDLNGKISLSGLTSEDGAHYISDVISQLMNGWVDIEKDTWVFDMNAIYELAPTMLFMLQAGINVETAAYFLSQPLIRDYIKASRVYNSLYNNALDSSPENEKGRGLLNYKAKRFVIENNDLLGNIFSPSIYEKFSYADKKVLNSNSISKYLGGKKSIGPAVDLFIKGFGKESFTADDIKNIVSSNDRKSSAAQLAFLHFLEIEEQSKVMIQIARATNVDTRKSGNLFQAQSRITRLEELQEGDRLPKEVVDRIINESPISAFFIQDYLLNVFKDYFPLRANNVINSYISDYISNNYNKILNEYKDVDTFISRFRNDILQFIMQNSIGVVDIDSVKTYKGFSLENTDTASIEKTRGLVKSAAYIDGKIYVDRELLRKEYNQKLYNLDTYGQGTLYSLPKDLSTDLIPYFSTEKQYAGFVLEREFLRGTTERLQDETDTAFEERIANNALDNIFNSKKIFFTKTSFADQLEAIKTIPGLIEQYSLLEDNLVYDAQQVKKEGKVYTIKNIKLVGDTKDAEFLADMNAQFEELADPSVQKIADPVLNREVSYFFNKLSIYGFIQSGMNKSNITFIPILSSKNFKDVMREPVKTFANILSSDKQKGFSILYNYTNAFNNKSNSYRFKSYVIDSTINKLGKSLKALPAGISSTLTPRVYNFNLSLKKDAANTIDHINNYPELVGTYGMALDNTGINNVKIDTVLGNTTRVKGNSIGLPMYKSLLGQPTLLQVADHSENLTIITDVIKHLKESYDSGKSLLFNKEGYSISFDDVNTDKEAYFELFKELYYNFGYLNPKLENNSEFMNYIYSVQPLNQNILEAAEEDVEDKNIVADADPLTDPECGPNSIM
jgi:hypothetical protein